MKYQTSFAAALTALVVGAPLAAQTPDTIQIPELLVTALKTPVPRALTSASTTVLTGTTLRAQGLNTVADALRSVAGAAVVQNGSFGSISSLFMRGGESDYTLVMVDGVRVNSPGGLYDFSNLTLENVERIEIVRGPSSVLYGSDAVTGVVHVITKNGSVPAYSAQLVLGGGDRVGTSVPSDNRNYSVTSANLEARGSAGPVQLSFGGSHFESGGAYAFNNDYRNTSVSGRAGIGLGASWVATLTGRYTDSEYHFPTDGSGLPIDANQFRTTQVVTTALELAGAVAPRIDARLRVGLNDQLERYRDEPDSPADTFGSPFSHSRGRVRRQFADLNASYNLGAYSIVTVGGEIEQQKDRNSYHSDGQFGPFDSSMDQDRSSTGVYAQALHTVGALTINGGTRVDHNDRFGTFFTYRAGASVRIAAATRLRAAIGTGFKEPTFFENYAQGFTTGNPDLEPEQSRSWEAGIEHNIGQFATLRATAFFQRFRDMIQYSPAAIGEPNYRNLAGARADGAEVEITVSPIRRLQITASHTYLSTEVTDEGTGNDAQFQEGTELLRRPAHTTSISALVNFSRGNVSLRTNRIGQRDDLDFASFPAQRKTLDAYMTVDIAAAINAIRIGDTRVQLTARIENALDEQYEEVLSFPARGRALYAGVRVER